MKHTLVFALLLAGAAQAQQRADTVQKTFFVRKDLAWTAGIVAGSAAVSVFDKRIAAWTRRPGIQGDSSRRDFVNALTVVNETPLTLAGVLVYGYGRLTHDDNIADAGLHTTEAIVVTVAIAEAIRGPLGRSRPRTSPDDQYNFKAGGGFTDFSRRAYPSIHAAVAFAAASSLVGEIRLHKPERAAIAAPILYTVAAIPGFTRMYLDQHWASDIVAGTALGLLIGHRVVHYAHTHQRSKFDRVMLGVSLVPDGLGGIMLVKAF